MKKLLLLSALLIFACSGDDSNDNNNENNISELLNCDGNPIPTIVYGTKEWALENACHTTYRDGTPIPEVTDQDEWINLTTGAWCYYNNDPNNKYKLYNWYAVAGIHNSASFSDPTLRKEFGPEGWHVPDDDEWNKLVEYLITNGFNYDGTVYDCSPCSFFVYEPVANTFNYLDTIWEQNKIGKSMASTTGWVVPFHLDQGFVGTDQSLNNSSSFNAIPEGSRQFGGLFYLESNIDEGIYADFWSSTDYAHPYAGQRFLTNNSPGLYPHSEEKSFGFSVRLVKD